MASGEWFMVAGKVIAATDNGLLIEPEHDPDEKSWVPRRFVDGGDDIQKGDDDVFAVASWLAKDRGWLC